MRHPFLEQLVDYAGLFPPAELPMADAVQEYAAHLTESESWILARFICPARRLSELMPFAPLFSSDRPLRLSILPRPNADLPAAISQASAESRAFSEAFGAPATVETFEARAGTSCVPWRTLRGAALAAAGRTLFLEWPASLYETEHCLDEIAQARANGSSNLGAKIRCGGTEPTAFPSVETVARFVHGCSHLGIPFKATAGLHHPVRHERDGVWMHGFLNVFGAAVLDASLDLDLDTVTSIISETDPAAFRLTDAGFSWRDLSASSESVTDARHLAHGYGSCSFAEPVDDLSRAGWFDFDA
jgi:hypothetical protein